MADAIWPVSLPQAPLTAKLSGGDEPRVVSFSTDTGPPIVRRRTTAHWERWSIGLLLTRTQLATLNTFFRDTVQAGALSFQWKHHETGNQVDYRFVGEPSKRAKAPRNVAGTDVWEVEFELVTVPGTEVTGSEPPPPAPPDPLVLLMMMMPFDPPSEEEADAGPGEYSFTLIREAVAAEPDVYVPLYVLPFDPPSGEDADQVGGGFEDGSVLNGAEPGGYSGIRFSTGDTGSGGGGESTS